MFKNIVRETPFTTTAANEVFSKIIRYGQPFQSDTSLPSTLRALVATRIKKDESLTISFLSSAYSTGEIQSSKPNTIINAMLHDSPNETGSFIIHNICNVRAEDNVASIQTVKDNFTSVYGNYHRLVKITDFFQKSFPILCYINTDIKSVVVFVEKLDVKKLHYIQCAIPAMLPWYFTPENNVAGIELEVLESLRKGNFEDYMRCIEEIASQYDFKTARIKELLTGFEARFDEGELRNMKNELFQIDDQLVRLNNSVRDSIIRRNNLCAQLLGLELKIAGAGEESEIMDYFLYNKKLWLDEVSGTEIYFTAGDYITYWEKEVAERVISNENSFVYRDRDGKKYKNIQPEKMAKLIKAIFIDEGVRIKFCANFSFSVNGVRASQNYNFATEFRTFMPNPHLDGFHCLGNHQKTINELLQKRDYVEAIEQCISSVKSLNWTDSAVMGMFMDTMYGDLASRNNKCIELPDGSIVNPMQAIAWLESQEETEKPEAAEAETLNTEVQEETENG